jgi:homoserine O-acetyltransferase
VATYRLFIDPDPFPMKLGGELPGFQLAYETWGELSSARDNGILLQTGLSPGSHAKSRPDAPQPGWWEEFIGPGLALDTSRFFVICSNVLGGCYGSTGPSSIDRRTGRAFALGFPRLSVEDMVRAQHRLVRHLGIARLHAAVGSSMGGMQSLMYAALFPDEVANLVAISTAGRSYPWSIAVRFVQRQAVLMDPDWSGGDYYDGRGPLHGLHLARQIGTISYRGPGEWAPRFGRERAWPEPPGEGILDAAAPEAEPGRAEPQFPDRPGVEAARPHRFGVDFQVESYLAHQADKFVRIYDANSYLYISKAMDLFDLGDGAPSYEEGVARVRARSFIAGVPTDLLFPLPLQEEIAEILRSAGRDVTFHRLESIYGHDSFLVEVDALSPLLRGFLGERGIVRSRAST